MNNLVIKHFNYTALEFDKIYSDQKNFISRLLDNWLRWDMKQRLLRSAEVINDYPNSVVMDIGAGSGRFFLPILKSRASHIIAIEPAEGMVKVAKALINDNNIEDKVTIYQVPFLEFESSIQCDVSLAIGLYDYLDNPLSYLKKSRQLTKQAMIATFPVKGTVRAAIRKIRLTLKRCPVYYYSVGDVERLLKEAGFMSWEVERFGQLIFVVAKCS